MNAIVFDAKLVGNDSPHAQSDFPIRPRPAKLNELIIRYWRKSRLKPSVRSRIAKERDSDDQQKNDQPTSHVDLSNLRTQLQFPNRQVNRDDVLQTNVANEIANLQRGSGGGYSGGMNMPFAWMPGPVELLVIGSMIAIPVGAIAVIVWLLRKK